jgi:hypothetical protein
VNNAFKSVKSSTTIQHNYMNNKLINQIYALISFGVAISVFK